MSPKILIKPDELRHAARRLRDGATHQSEVTCDLGGAIPEMPPDLRGRVESTISQIKADLGQQQQYMGREALELTRRAALAERADGGVFAFGLGGLLGLGDVPALDEDYTPPPPPAAPKKKKGNGLLNALGEITGVNDAKKALDDFGKGNILGGLGNLAFALPTPLGKGAKAVKGANKVIGGGKDAAKAGKKGDDVAKPAAPKGKPDGPLPPLGHVDRTLQRSRKRLDDIKEHTTSRDLDAARRERNGEVVARKRDGTPYNHVQEVRDAQKGLMDRIRELNRIIANPASTPAQRADAQVQLGEASRLLDHTEQFVPRRK